MPLVQLVEDRTVGTSGGVPLLLSRSVPPSRATSRFVVPLDLGERDGGVVLTNRESSPIVVTLSLRDASGSAGTPVPVLVPAGAQRALSAGDLFPEGVSFRGTLEGAAPRNVDVVGFFRRASGRGEDLLAGFPVLEAADPPPAGAALFPFATDGDSWRSAWCFVNLRPEPLDARLAFRNSSGEAAYFPIP